MKRILLALVLSGVAMRAANAGGEPGTQVTVYLDDQVNIPIGVMGRATMEASRTFANIGVPVQWTRRKLNPADSVKETGCRMSNKLSIALTLIPYAPAKAPPGARAVANTRTGEITVFYDRIRESSVNWPRLVPMLLANVMAHEVTHVLQGVGQHADHGIMNANWTVRDFHAMEDRSLQFTPMDIRIIHLGFASRSCPAATVGDGQ